MPCSRWHTRFDWCKMCRTLNEMNYAWCTASSFRLLHREQITNSYTFQQSETWLTSTWRNDPAEEERLSAETQSTSAPYTAGKVLTFSPRGKEKLEWNHTPPVEMSRPDYDDERRDLFWATCWENGLYCLAGEHCTRGSTKAGLLCRGRCYMSAEMQTEHHGMFASTSRSLLGPRVRLRTDFC